MGILVNVVPGSEKWLADRWKSLGATDGVGAIGLSPWCHHKHLLWLKRLGKAAAYLEPSPPNAQMLEGIASEDRIAQLFCKITGKSVKPTAQYYHSIYNWLTATLDRELDDGTPVEIKSKTALPVWPSIEHLVQVLFQLFVTNKEFAYLIYGVRGEPNDEYQIWKVHFSQSMWDSFIWPRLMIFLSFWKGKEALTHYCKIPFTHAWNDWQSITHIKREINMELLYSSRPADKRRLCADSRKVRAIRKRKPPQKHRARAGGWSIINQTSRPQPAKQIDTDDPHPLDDWFKRLSAKRVCREAKCRTE